MNNYLCVGGPLDGARVAASGNVMRVTTMPPAEAMVGAGRGYDIPAATPARVAEYHLRWPYDSEPVWQFHKFVTG